MRLFVTLVCFGHGDWSFFLSGVNIFMNIWNLLID